MSLFCCRGITKQYQQRDVIRGVSLHLEQGEIVSLLGYSGVGKTTLMGVLAGVEPPDAGLVLLEGMDITAQPGRVGYMLQKDLLLPFKRTADNVCLPLVLGGMGKQEARAQAKELLERFGLGGSQEKYPHQLSGGMRQRAALLRTYLTGHKVVLLDEPFSALDALTKEELHRWYLDTAQDLGLTTLLITHDVDEALKLSDRIYILAGAPGQIKMEYAVPFSAPRGETRGQSPGFYEEKARLMAALA